MSRAHTQGFDSNAAQFERMGNPWNDVPGMTRSQRKRLAKKFRPCRPGLPRLVERESREGNEHMADIQAMSRIRQALGKSARSVQPIAKPVEPPIALAIKPSRETELDPWHPERIAAEAATLARKAAQARLAADRVKYDQMQKALAAYGKKMSKILG